MADEKEDLTASKELLKDVEGSLSSGNYLGILQSVSQSPPNCKDAEVQVQCRCHLSRFHAISAMSAVSETNCSAGGDRFVQTQENEYGLLLETNGQQRKGGPVTIRVLWLSVSAQIRH